MYIVILCGLACTSALLLNETFDNLSNWIEDIEGATGVISIEADHNHGGSLVFTNITYCPYANASTYCYRAELATPQDERSNLFATNTVEYWLGYSSYIPNNWIWSDNGNEQDIIYNFQLHGGDNTGNSPPLLNPVSNGKIEANV